jgi:endonuclease III
MRLAAEVKDDKNIPLTMDELDRASRYRTKICQCHNARVGREGRRHHCGPSRCTCSPRLGIAIGTDPKKIEKQMMEVLDPKDWGEAGMVISFLGREICRPTNPKHAECVMKDVCDYYKSLNN